MKQIELTRGKVALVDDDVFDYMSQWTWCTVKSGNKFYAFSGGGILMHRIITEAPDDMFVDHINGNGLDNRRKNLRICTPAENTANRKKNKNNTSGFKGVYWRSKKRLFEASIRKDKKYHYLGYFELAIDAALAYDAAAKKLFGEFALLNFPNGEK